MRKTTILIVEDEAIVATHLAGKLGRLGYEVSGRTARGEEAVVFARESRPDLVLMDIRLKGDMDGVEAAEIIRRECDLPVIYLTSHSDRATLQRAKLTQPFGYILKPFEELDLEIRIQMALYNHETDRKLRQSEERYRLLFDRNPDGVFAVDAEGRFVVANPACETISGYSVAELLRMTFMELCAPDQLTKTIAMFERSLRGQESLQLETAVVRKDGRRVEIWVAGDPLIDGRNTVVHCTAKDITERRRAQAALQQTTEELKRSNRDLEQFAYVASHDLQEPLRAVDGYVKLLQRRLPADLDDKALGFITGAVDGVARMERLIHDLLAYARVRTGGGDFVLTDLNRVVPEALENLRSAITAAGAKVTTEPMPRLAVDPPQMMRLFQNLVGNAIKFCGQRPPEIHIGAQKRDDRWVFSVRDNGIGIAPQYFERIFQIFQRLHTRDEYPGTGIGLAICKRIVERHGGVIWVESQPEQGSTFYFSLPADTPQTG